MNGWRQHLSVIFMNQKDINISKDLWWGPAAVASPRQIHSGHHLIKSGSSVTSANTLSCVYMQMIINRHKSFICWYEYQYEYSHLTE